MPIDFKGVSFKGCTGIGAYVGTVLIPWRPLELDTVEDISI